MMTRHLTLIIMIVVLSFPFVGNAQEAPLPERKSMSLNTLKNVLSEQREKKETLEEQIVIEEQDIKKLSKKLVRITKEVHKQEAKLNKHLQRAAILQREKDQIISSLQNRKKEIEEVLGALYRLQQLPGSNVIVSTENAENVGIINASLSYMFPPILKKVEKLETDLEELKTIESDLSDEEEEIRESRNRLAKDQRMTEALIDKRKELFSEHKSLISVYSRRIQDYAQQAKTMEELFNRLQTAKPQLLKKPQYKEVLPVKGSWRLPIPGAINVSFGGIDKIGAKSEGIYINPVGSQTAVAPMGGIIRYVGSFNTYQNMVIIEHKDKYHSVVSGLDQTSVEAGQSVIAGEPIGVIDNSQRKNTLLYYELRYKGRPINPLKS